ncbi:DUF4329 domain-containing protein [Pseudomonas atagonensis]|uniref:DUF4329 domain-containing protein n=1 Tax=Pseudomonas atagonensis TaxID=2609964 RepID=UPI001407DA32|nr:DUF4329 domain-containing protein [Pseudomonas atagonensis]
MSDQTGRDTRAAEASRPRLPRLSPGFLTEEDAAHWVQTYLPANADREYASVIVRLADGEFAATRPVPGDGDGFDFRTILEVDSAGNFLQPKGATCVASVRSHPPVQDTSREVQAGVDKPALGLFINFFSDTDFIANVAQRDFFRRSYLCVADGSLLSYTPSGSQDELDYYLWLKAGAPREHPLAVYGVENVIKKVATVGELRVIVSSADWRGALGTVPPDWRPGLMFGKGVVTGLPLMTRICASAGQAVQAALTRRSARTSGLVLKKVGTNEYVATQPRPAGTSPWEPGTYFARRDDGHFILPDGYALDGFYYGSRPDPYKFPRHQPWLYENFFTPAEVAFAIACSHQHRLLAAPFASLSLYMLATDAAILKYTFSDSRLERALSIKNPDGTIGDGGLQAKLHSGVLRPREFVSVVAAAGQLEVLRASRLWDRLGAVTIEWQPYAGYPWPAMGPTFLSADDAARYAHEKIAQRRDREYAGYIFQREDLRFTVTEPLQGGVEENRRRHLFPQDNHGNPVFPDGHDLRGRYVSHKALSTLDSADVERRKWSREDAALSLQMFSVEEIRRALLDDTPLYLSGAPHSLVRFQAANVEALEQRLGTAQEPGPLALALESGASLPSDFIREVAAAGQLFNLLNNALWGARGLISPTWSVATGPWQWQRPEHVAFGAIFSTADDAAQDRYFHDERLHDEEKAWFGFILKHRDREEYVASELVPVSKDKNNVFQPQALFGVARQAPWLQYPEGFSRQAFFYSRQRVKHLLAGTSASWLSQNFIEPDDLYIAIYYSQRRPVIEPWSDQQIPLFISTQDGALLRYQRRVASKLFDNDTPNMGLEDIKNHLGSGNLRPEDFVKLVANSGELTVLRTSLCWDRSAPVDPTWRPSMNIERRWLGPAFHEQDDAVIEARSRLPDHPQKIFGGVVLKRADGLFVASDPVEVPQEDFDVKLIFPDESLQAGLFPQDCTVVARYRSRVAAELPVVFSHTEKQVYLNMLSVDTLYSSFSLPDNLRKIEYLFAPDGSLIRYEAGLWSRLRADLANALNDFKSLPADLDGKKVKQQIYSGALQPSVWVNLLARAGYLQVVSGSRLWGARGAVSVWQPFAPAASAEQTQVAPVCSPVFVQDDAAACHVHRLSQERDSLTVGLILSNEREGLFIATLPVEAQDSPMVSERVFLAGKLPTGFALHALYARVANVLPSAPSDDFRRFFPAPMVVHRLCEAAYTPQGYKPVFFSCADGALLRFDMSPFEPGEFTDPHGQVEIRPNQFASLQQASKDESDLTRGRFDPVEYVRRMARAGKLEVILGSAYWSRHGVLGKDWQPHMADVTADERWAARPVPALGPVFHHADDAARYAQQRAGRDFAVGSGFESAILARAPRLLDRTPRFVALEPLASSASGASPVSRIFRPAQDPSINFRNPAPRYPDGYTLVASHQLYLSGNTTLAADDEQVHANFAAPFMVRAHTHDLKDKGFDIKDYYYSTPYGVLIRYSPGYTQAERELLRSKQVEFSGGKWVTRLSPAQFISRLVELEEFRVLIAGPYWKQSGRIGSTWRSRRKLPAQLGVIKRREEL